MDKAANRRRKAPQEILCCRHRAGELFGQVTGGCGSKVDDGGGSKFIISEANHAMVAGAWPKCA